MNSGSPLGPLVAPAPAKRPERKTLEGRVVRLVPLDAGAHGDDLFAAANGQDEIWAYMGDGPYPDREAFQESLEVKSKSEDPLFFAIVDQPSGRALGYQTLMRIDAANRVVEVGNVLFTPAMQRTIGATEAQFLFARYVFDELGYRRYEWKCNNFNAPSKRAAERFGFIFEGVFRQHMIIKGHNRDTAWFSMLDQEWPRRRAAFEAWLAPENFDADGRQRNSLTALRNE